MRLLVEAASHQVTYRSSYRIAFVEVPKHAERKNPLPFKG